jgi:glutamate formiminotransferase
VPVIECVPNISEGRRPEVIARCGDAIRGAGARLLDVSADAAHNRCVFTFVGDAPTLGRAAAELFDCAIASIDLRRHQGEHPRLGAVDVVPFVPIEDATMDECVALARRVGARVAARHQLPVFLYEDAALIPDRRRLEEIRRGGFEGLAAKLQQPAWRPDFGPAAPHPSAGATVIGARPPLIAFNINLRTDDLSVAKSIAATIRESSGGLPFVKAMGVRLADRGMVQVSMNLTNFRQTSMRRVFDEVAREASRVGVDIDGSEIVGLAPREALEGTTPADLKLEGRDWILEDRLNNLS